MRHVRAEFSSALGLQEKARDLEAYVQYLKCLGHILQYLRLDTQSWQPRFTEEESRNLFALARNCLEMSEKLADDNKLFQRNPSLGGGTPLRRDAAVRRSLHGMEDVLRQRAGRGADDSERRAASLFIEGELPEVRCLAACLSRGGVF